MSTLLPASNAPGFDEVSFVGTVGVGTLAGLTGTCQVTPTRESVNKDGRACILPRLMVQIERS